MLLLGVFEDLVDNDDGFSAGLLGAPNPSFPMSMKKVKQANQTTLAEADTSEDGDPVPMSRKGKGKAATAAKGKARLVKQQNKEPESIQRL